MKVNWDDDIPNIWENSKNGNQTTNQKIYGWKIFVDDSPSYTPSFRSGTVHRQVGWQLLTVPPMLPENAGVCGSHELLLRQWRPFARHIKLQMSVPYAPDARDALLWYFCRFPLFATLVLWVPMVWIFSTRHQTNLYRDSLGTKTLNFWSFTSTKTMLPAGSTDDVPAEVPFAKPP